jgi:hypothetical protein
VESGTHGCAVESTAKSQEFALRVIPWSASKHAAHRETSSSRASLMSNTESEQSELRWRRPTCSRSLT